MWQRNNGQAEDDLQFRFTAYLVSAVKRRRKDYLIQLYKRNSIESAVEAVYESEPSSEEVVLDRLPLMDVIENGVLLEALQKLKKGDILPVNGLSIKEGETSPPKRYNSGSMILAMENAGQLIEDEELRAQIKGSGIGTSATRAEILKKLFNIKYLALNKKTQVITPTLLGEMIFDVVNCSIRQLLNPELTASWEKGLTYVAEGSITEQEYMDKLEHFVRLRTRQVEDSNIQPYLRQFFDAAAVNYKDSSEKNSAKTTGRSTSAAGRSRTCRKPSASK